MIYTTVIIDDAHVPHCIRTCGLDVRTHSMVSMVYSDMGCIRMIITPSRQRDVATLCRVSRVMSRLYAVPYR